MSKPLDPYPWREGTRRLGRESGGSGAVPVVFDPRPEYEQERDGYEEIVPSTTAPNAEMEEQS